MNRSKAIILIISILIILLYSQFALADKEIKLLAVEEDNPEATGSIATLSIKTVRGEGNIYLDTFPLTKLDTQISLRFSKDTACGFSEVNCNNKDFLYKLRADSSIVGGPSAGAAGTILTIAELEDLDINPNVSITGTINSGNFIGAVGGIKGKIKAASENGITKVLIPKTGNFEKNNENNSLGTIEDFGKTIGIEVIEVNTIEEALSYITNYIPKENNDELIISNRYSDVMEQVSKEMCDRTDELIKEFESKGDKINQDIINATQNSNKALEESKFYSASSFCFNNNIRLRQSLYKNLTSDEFNDAMNALKSLELKDINYNSPNNLQVYLIVNNRFWEMKETLDRAQKEFNEGNKEGAFNLLAYSRERAFSIGAWTKLFTEDKEELNYDLKTSCIERVTEANERLQYARLFIPDLLNDAFETLNDAKKSLDSENYPECISKSIEVKVQSNTILTTIGLTIEELPSLVDEKLEFAQREIASQNYFPILAYSYYEYGQSLNSNDPASALLYAEYSLEMANLDSYLSLDEEDKNVIDSVSSIIDNNEGEVKILIIGILIGLIIGTSISFRKISKNNKRKKR